MLDLAPPKAQQPADEPSTARRGEPDRPLAVTVGSVHGAELVIRAIARLRAAGTEVRYVVASDPIGSPVASGCPSSLGTLAEIARRCAVADLVELAPAHDWSALRALVRRADVVVVPCAPGDLAPPYVLAEAVAAGKPVVATDCADIHGLGRAGAVRLVPHSATRYASAINTVLTDARARHRMEAASRAAAAIHDWKAVSAQFESIIAGGLPAG
ncbi:MAG: glycosyltransferase [Ilumatobacteraceae bacterium]